MPRISGVEHIQTIYLSCKVSLISIVKSLHTIRHNPEAITEARKRDVLRDIVVYLVPLGAFLVWCLSLQGINVRQMNNLGLISVFPPSLIGALVVMTSGFCFIIHRPKRRYTALAIYFGLLIFMLYGVNNLIEDMPRFAVVYRHAAFIEYIMRTGISNPALDAYFNWPGFFSLSAFITKIAGYPDILGYAGWAPVFYNVFYFCPLYMLFTCFTDKKPTIYLSIWLFYLTNWIGQDYFSPQGLNFFLYLVIIAILVKWFKASPNEQGRSPQSKLLEPPIRKFPLLASIYPRFTAPDLLTTSIQSWQRRSLIVCIIFIFSFIVFSHPLTPFLVISSVLALVICRRCYLWWLPLLMIVITTLWIVFMTQAYLAGHMADVFSGFHPFSSFSKGVTNRVAGDPQHTLITRIRIYMSVFVWGCAFMSAFLRWRRGFQDATIILLALAPFSLFVIQPYGGEMILRSYLFSLPPMVFLMAAFLHTVPLLKKDSWHVVASACLCLILLGGFFYTRYGNENMDYITDDEFAGLTYLYSIAPSKSLFLAPCVGAPLYKDFEKYTIVNLENSDLFQATPKQNINQIEEYFLSQGHNTTYIYIVFTRSQKATFTSMSGLSQSSFDQIKQKITASNNFHLIYHNPDTQIYQLIAKGKGIGQ